MSDKQLAELAKDGDQEAFGILYERYFERVMQYAYRRTFDKQIAYDITANVFLKVAEGIRGFKPKHDNAFVGWVFKIANREVIGYYRKPEAYKSIQGLSEIFEQNTPSETEGSAEALDTLELYRSLHQAMQKLPVREQHIIDLYYFENLSYREIADSTGLRESNVGVMLHRSIKKLHKELSPIVAEGGLTL